MTSLMLVPCIGLMGASVDMIRVARAQAQLNTAVDAGVLASASLTSAGDPEQVMREFIRANVTNQELLDNLEIDVTGNTVAINKRVMSVSVKSEIRTYFLGLLNIDTLDVAAVAEAQQSKTNIEIALVLDISSSMSGSKLTELKAAATDFVETMLDADDDDTTSISLVPFGGTVNIGQDLFDDFVVVDSDADDDDDGVITDPTLAQYHINNDVLTSSFRFSDGNTCIEYQLDDFDTDILPATSRGQVPHFWKWTNFNPWCPEDESAILLNTNDLDDLTDRIDEFTLSDGTGMDLGSVWGLWALSPSWRGRLGGDFNDRPADFDDEETLKVAVLMSDGDITNQARPRDYRYFSTHDRPWPHDKNRGGVGNSYRDDNDQEITGRGNVNHDISNDSAVGRFNHVCDLMKDNGVAVYTIGFQVSVGSNADQYLKACASSISNYYFVEEVDDIGAAFESIAASVSRLRLTG